MQYALVLLVFDGFKVQGAQPQGSPFRLFWASVRCARLAVVVVLDGSSLQAPGSSGEMHNY